MKSQRDAFGEALLEQGKINEKLFVVNADLAGPTKSIYFTKEFPDREIDVGIAEQNAIGVTAGLGKSGLRPFFVSFAVFTASNLDQVRMSVAYSKAPAVLVGTHAGLIGKDGASHQALEDVANMSSLPGMNVFQPADAIETKQIVEYLANNDKMAYLRLSRHPQEEVHDSEYKFEFNKADSLLEHKNSKIGIYSTGYLSTHALETAKMLSKQGLETDVLNFSTLSPIDKDSIINYAKGKDYIFTLEDHNINGGLGSRVSEVIAENGLGVKVKRYGMHGFGESGSPEDLYVKFGLDTQSLVNRIKDNIYIKK
jgi:transketolase